MTKEPIVKPNKSRQERVIILTVTAFILAAVILIALDWKDVRQVTSKANWHLTLVALLFTLISYFCLSYGYVLVNKAFSIKVGWRRLFAVGFVSSALNNIIAFMGAAGHSLRLMMMRRHEVPPGGILAASIFHSYLSNIMMITLPIIGLIYLLVGHIVQGGTAVAFTVIAGILIFTLAVATAMMLVRPIRAWVLGISNRLWHLITHHNITSFTTDLDDALTNGVTALKNNGSVLFFILVIMAANWVFIVATLWFCFEALGTAPNLGILLAGFGIGIAAGNISMIPGGLGVQEASLAGIYALLGIPFAQAVLVSILFRVVYDFIPFLLSLGLYRRLIRRHS